MIDPPPEPVEDDAAVSETEAVESETADGRTRPDDPDFDLGVPRSEPRFDYLRMAAGVIVGLGILAIGLFSFTDLSVVLVPMDDAYLDVLRPSAGDDSGYPFVLNDLGNTLEGNTLTVTGVMTNNSTEIVENILAVIEVEETTGRFPATLEIPVDPEAIEPGETGAFSMSVTLRQRPNSYKVQFKLLNGPFVPHRDERGGRTGTVFPPPDPETPFRLNID